MALTHYELLVEMLKMAGVISVAFKKEHGPAVCVDAPIPAEHPLTYWLEELLERIHS